LLAPGFDPTEIATKVEGNITGKDVPLYAGKDGRLSAVQPTNKTVVGYVVEYNPSVLRFRLVI
jgi:hypothetical protein